MPGPLKTIDDYLKKVAPAQRAALQKVREQVLAIVPGAEECISYSMPAFRVRGQVVGGFLATKTGCSFFPFSGTTLDTIAADIAGYSRTKSALHFDPARGLPSRLLRKLLRARRAEIASASSKKALPKKKSPAKPAAKKKARGASSRAVS